MTAPLEPQPSDRTAPPEPRPAGAPAAAVQVWQLGRFTFHAGTRRLSDAHGSHALTLKSAEVLKRLIAGAGEVVSREQLIQEVWNGNHYTGSQALTHTIWQLRRALDATPEGGSDTNADTAATTTPPDEAAAGGNAAGTAAGTAGSAIATISKSGYRLTVPVSPALPGGTPAVMAAVGPTAVSASGPALPATSSSATTATSSPPDPAAPEPSGNPSTGSIPPRRTGTWLAALLVMAAVGITTAWFVMRSRGPVPQVITTPPLPLTMQDGVEDFPAWSPDGLRLAYTWQGLEGAAQIRIDNLGGPGASAPQASGQSSWQITDPQGRTLARPVWLGAHRLAYVRADDASDCRVFTIDLSNQERREVAGCYYARGQPVLDASPDGQWLAMARHVEGTAAVGIVLHRLADGQERVLTRPPAGFDDAEIAWSHDGKRLAFLRSNATVGDLHLLDLASGEVTRLTRDEAPVGGLTWVSDDSAIVFNSARGGSFATWRMAPAGDEPTLFARVDTPLNLTAVPGQPQAVAASVHRFSDHIALYRLADGQRLSAITSSGRDLYGQACPSAQQVVFNSLRSGRVELWRSNGQGSDARRIEMPAGIPEAVACLPDSSRFATSLRAPGAQFDQLVFGDLAGGPLTTFSEAAHFTNVTWGADGGSLIVASDRGSRSAVASVGAGGSGGAGASTLPGAEAGAASGGGHGDGSNDENGDGNGDWDLWRLDLANHRLQRLTDDHGSFGREVEANGGRWLYYARLGSPGLWRRPLAADGRPGPPQRVTDRLATDDWGNWQWHAGALWLVERASSEDRLVRLAPDGSTRVALTWPRGFVRPYSSLSIDGAGTALVTVSGPRQADIMRIGP